MRFFFLIVSTLLCGNSGNLLAQNPNINSPERIYIHTDRDAYIAGEDVYFKVYQIFLDKKYQSKYAYLIVRNVNNLNIISARLELNNGISYGKFSLPDTLSTGIYQIVGYTNCLRNDPENSFFTKPLIIANRFDKELKNLDSYASYETSIRSNLKDSSYLNDQFTEINNSKYLSVQIAKNTFNYREKIILLLKFNKDFAGKSANISISVKSAIPGFTDNTSISNYFNKAAQHRFNWKNCQFLQESQGIIINGMVQENDLKKPIANQIILLSTPDSVPNLQFTTTRTDGFFEFQLSDFYFGKKVYLKLMDSINAQIILNNKYYVEMPFTPPQINQLNDLKKYLLRNQEFVTIQKIYFNKQHPQNTIYPAVSHEFPWIFSKPQYRVFPSNFFELPDLLQISKELLPSLKIRKHNGEYVINMLNEPLKIFMKDAPLIFFNGIPIDNISQIISLGSTKIKNIDLCPTQRYFGGLIFDGILSIHADKQELDKIQWENPLITYWELNNHPLSTFDSSNYTNTSMNLPILKQLLYWVPNQTVNSDSQFEFYAPDNTGFFEINIQGITSEGLPISIQKTIQIVNK